MTTVVRPTLDDTHRPSRAWAAVVLLAIVGTLNYADRFLPAVLAEPIKVELALSDTAIGVINGFGFLAVYAVLGIVIARISDRGAFGLVISVCLTLWGAMTMLGGAVQSGFQLALTRARTACHRVGDLLVLQRHRRIGGTIPDRCISDALRAIWGICRSVAPSCRCR